MVLLVGGRLTPNFIGIQGYQPDAIECLVSEDTKAQYRDVLEVVSTLPKLELPEQPYIVPAYDMERIMDACRMIVASHPGAEVVFNVTCATKVMGIAAYEVARQTGQEAVYVDTGNGRFLNLTDRDQRSAPIRVCLRDYLGLYGRYPEKTFSFVDLSVSEAQALEAAAYLAAAGAAAVETLTLMRSQNRGKGRRSITLKHPLKAGQWDVLCRLDDLGLISNLSRSSDAAISYTIASNSDWNYLNGTWLEAYVWQQAQMCKSARGTPLFDDCDISMEIPTPEGVRREIDVACMFRGQLLHCSCKSEQSPFKTRYLDEIRAVSSLVGGRYCSRLFITNVAQPAEGDGGWSDYQKFLQQAEASQTVVVTGEDLAEVGAILQREAETPTYRRI